jgi:hypothetical protein
MEIRGISFDGRSREMVDADSTELHLNGAARHTVPSAPSEMSTYERELHDLGHRVAQSSVPKDLVKDRHVEVLDSDKRLMREARMRFDELIGAIEEAGSSVDLGLRLGNFQYLEQSASHRFMGSLPGVTKISM